MKIKHTISIFALFCLCYSCSNDEIAENSGNVANPEIISEGLRMDLFNVSNNIRDYSEVYVFKGEGASINYFDHKILNNNIERTGEYLKMSMAVGKWNIMLVGCNEMDIRSKLTPPTASAPRSNVLMWKTEPIGGVLPDVPEIRTATLNGVTIVEDVVETVGAALERNVAKVRVKLKDGVGFKTVTGTFSLKNVPTSLSWDGSLFPNKTNPIVSTVPMSKPVTLYDSPTTAGHQASDYVEFIIPAHKSTSPTDVTTHKIYLEVNFKTAGSTDFIKEVEIPVVPKNNTILEVNLTAKGGVEVQVDIKDWVTVFSSENIDMYSMTPTGNTGFVASYTLNMKQERNWWVTLEDTDYFEFVDESKTFGQKTTSPVEILVRRKAVGSIVTRSTKLNLHISGLDGEKEQYDITNLVQLLP